MPNHFDQGWGSSAPFVGLCSHKMARAGLVESGPKNTNQDETEHKRVKTAPLMDQIASVMNQCVGPVFLMKCHLLNPILLMKQ